MKKEPRIWFDDGIILYDGVCVLCSGWVRFVVKRDVARRFRFTPIQSPYGRRMPVRPARAAEHLPEGDHMRVLDGGMEIIGSGLDARASFHGVAPLAGWRHCGAAGAGVKGPDGRNVRVLVGPPSPIAFDFSNLPN